MTNRTHKADVLTCCEICGEPKQIWYVLQNGQKMLVNVSCACESTKAQHEDEKLQQRKREEHIDKLREEAFLGKRYQEYTFEKARGYDYIVKGLKAYVEHFPEMEAQNLGLILWGEVGVGKTFLAACIANALIDREVSVHMTSVAWIENALFSGEKNKVLDDLNRCRLLIIDDLDAERGSAFSLEQLHNAVDSRYASGKPLITTTNLKLNQLKNPKGTARKRIYSRILEMCNPVKVIGADRRRDIAEANFAEMKSVLGNRVS